MAFSTPPSREAEACDDEVVELDELGFGQPVLVDLHQRTHWSGSGT
jgi:hypothetical protein